MSKLYQRLLKTGLEISTLSASPSTNLNWDQSSGGSSSLESEWSNQDSESETAVSSSEGDLYRYSDINEENSELMGISHSCLDFRRNSHEELPRRDVGGLSLGYFTFLRHSTERMWELFGLLWEMC